MNGKPRHKRTIAISALPASIASVLLGASLGSAALADQAGQTTGTTGSTTSTSGATVESSPNPTPGTGTTPTSEPAPGSTSGASSNPGSMSRPSDTGSMSGTSSTGGYSTSGPQADHGQAGMHSGSMDHDASMQMHKAMMDGMTEMHGMKPTGNPDKDFAHMMEHHHAQAVKMTESYLKGAKDPQLKAWAEKTLRSQQQELEDLRKLDKAGSASKGTTRQ
jgi:hypothetical protein